MCLPRACYHYLQIDYDGTFDWRMLPDAAAAAGPGTGGAGPDDDMGHDDEGADDRGGDDGGDDAGEAPAPEEEGDQGMYGMRGAGGGAPAGTGRSVPAGPGAAPAPKRSPSPPTPPQQYQRVPTASRLPVDDGRGASPRAGYPTGSRGASRSDLPAQPRGY